LCAASSQGWAAQPHAYERSRAFHRMHAITLVIGFHASTCSLVKMPGVCQYLDTPQYAMGHRYGER
jgi:hypothetical protein